MVLTVRRDYLPAGDSLMDEWIKKSVCLCVCVCRMEYYSAIKKVKSSHCNNMGGPRGHYFVWNKSERQIP